MIKTKGKKVTLLIVRKLHEMYVGKYLTLILNSCNSISGNSGGENRIVYSSMYAAEACRTLKCVRHTCDI